MSIKIILLSIIVYGKYILQKVILNLIRYI